MRGHTGQTDKIRESDCLTELVREFVTEDGDGRTEAAGDTTAEGGTWRNNANYVSIALRSTSARISLS